MLGFESWAAAVNGERVTTTPPRTPRPHPSPEKLFAPSQAQLSAEGVLEVLDGDSRNESGDHAVLGRAAVRLDGT